MRKAVRIQMRGVVLNKKGTYNRCKLTRLVVDRDWEDQVWKEAGMPWGKPGRTRSEQYGRVRNAWPMPPNQRGLEMMKDLSRNQDWSLE